MIVRILAILIALMLTFPLAQTIEECTPEELEFANINLNKTIEAIDFVLRSLESPNDDVIALLDKWFGANSSDDLAVISNTYLLSYSFAEATAFVCVRTESMSTWAAVDPNVPFRIYLFPRFFVSPDLEYDSPMGTLIHEFTHFNLNGMTDDVIYQPENALELAKSDPSQARNNADNYQYFVEDLIYFQ